MWAMPSGSKIRSRSSSSRPRPDSTSHRWPHTSVATEYDQRVPGENEEWQFGQLVDHLGQRRRAVDVDAPAPVQRVDRMAGHEAVGQPRGVGQQVTDLHLPLGERRRVAVGGAVRPHPQVRPGGDEAGDGIVELEAALLVERHQRHRDDRLGHRVDAEDRVGGHRLAGGDVSQPRAAQVCDPTLPGDERQHAGELAGGDVALLEERRDPGQALGGQADLARLVEHRRRRSIGVSI